MQSNGTTCHQRCQDCSGSSSSKFFNFISFPTCFGKGNVKNASADLSTQPMRKGNKDKYAKNKISNGID